jgi:hypothetical protein
VIIAAGATAVISPEAMRMEVIAAPTSNLAMVFTGMPLPALVEAFTLTRCKNNPAIRAGSCRAEALAARGGGGHADGERRGKGGDLAGEGEKPKNSVVSIGVILATACGSL